MLPKFTSVGCYPIFYFKGGDCLCPECAETEGATEKNAVVNWEDSSLCCDECSAPIESAYGENDATATG